ncbi:unnamed protein product [Porites evermanni]|uniref:Saccharopine dehydrogenase [NAD(+), L-lysine-forming] n=1 Tax=Porites evermanni TaxID=104178 RepID=A0ABN8SX08_9CNID|nr:unnamed protein product [Porites evermanni]
MAVHLWLRSEPKMSEHRTALTPAKCKELVSAGFQITVENSKDRIFKDEEYARINGVSMAPEGSWVYAPKDTFILGIKELAESDSSIPQTHIYFAHAYKNQAGWVDLLNRFIKGGGKILDVEYMTDDSNRRLVATFPHLAGFSGMAVGLKAWCLQQLRHVSTYSCFLSSFPHSSMPSLEPYDNEKVLVNDVKMMLQNVSKAKGLPDCHPRIVVIGALGRCGKGALDMAYKAGIPSTHIAKWDINETKTGGPFEEILQYDIFVNNIKLTKLQLILRRVYIHVLDQKIALQKIPPFLTRKVLDTDQRNLSVVVDVSCDVSNPNNPLPFLDSITTFQNPSRRLQLSNCTKPLDLVAIDNLPSLLPRESTVLFADSITPYLLKLPEVVDSHPVWVRAKEKFEEKVAEVLKRNVKKQVDL